jgi:hypothetical protein
VTQAKQPSNRPARIIRQEAIELLAEMLRKQRRRERELRRRQQRE